MQNFTAVDKYECFNKLGLLLTLPEWDWSRRSYKLLISKIHN